MILDVIYSMYASIKSRGKIKIGIFGCINSNTQIEGHNYIGRQSSAKDSRLGYASYIGKNSGLSKTRIGRFTSIGDRVNVISGAHPVSQCISTHPAFYTTHTPCGFTFVSQVRYKEHMFSDEPYLVDIGNDAWIGSDVKILQGVTIGDGAIIGCGAVVTKSIPPYAVCVGVPAKVIRFRFCNEEIEILLHQKWWNKNLNDIQQDSVLFMQPKVFFEKYKKAD